MNKRKLLLLQNDDYLGVARAASVADTNVIFRINDSANRRNGGMTLFSPGRYFHDTSTPDRDTSALNSVLGRRFDDSDYYGAG